MHFVSVSVINYGSMYFMFHASSMKRSRISSFFKLCISRKRKKDRRQDNDENTFTKVKSDERYEIIRDGVGVGLDEGICVFPAIDVRSRTDARTRKSDVLEECFATEG